MPKGNQLAKLIEVEQQGKSTSLRIDGEEFPYFIDDAGVSTTVKRGDMGAITITIPADEVRVVNRLQPPPPPEVDWLLRDADTGAELQRYPTCHSVLEGDIVTATDGALWRVKRRDAENLVLDVVSAGPTP